MSWWPKKYDRLTSGSIDGTDTTPHDNAIYRAMNASYSCSSADKLSRDPLKTIFVGRINYSTSEETLRSLFSRDGRVKSVHIPRHKVTGMSCGYAFVEFEDSEGFIRAYERTNGMTVDGRAILVDCERERLMKGWVPRRLGGGLGGRRESGQLRFGGRMCPFHLPIVDRKAGQRIEDFLPRESQVTYSRNLKDSNLPHPFLVTRYERRRHESHERKRHESHERRRNHHSRHNRIEDEDRRWRKRYRRD